MGITAETTRSLTRPSKLRQPCSVDWTPNLQGVQFNGTDEYGTMSVDALADTFTVSAWVKYAAGTTASADYDYIISFGAAGTRTSFNLARHATTDVVYIYDGSGELNGTTAIPVGKWVHVAIVVKPTTDRVKLYLNGVADTIVQPASDFAIASSTGAIARYNLGASHFGIGGIDEVAIFPRALLATEVSEIYNNGRPRDLTKYNPVGWWRLGDTVDGSGATVPDLGYGKNDATLVNIPLYKQATASTYSDYSIAFNGSDEYMTTGADGTLEDKTYTFWAKSAASAADAANTVFSHGNKDNRAFSLNWSSSRPLMYMGYGHYCFWVDTPAQDDNAWHFWTVVVDASNVALSLLYLDGVLQTRAATSGTTNSLDYTGLVIGGSANSKFNGSIDEFAVFDGHLSSATINEIYSEGIPGKLTGHSPEHWWRMGEDDGGTGTLVTDVIATDGEALHLPGIVSNYASVPDAADLDGFTNFTLEAKGVTLPDWTPSAEVPFISKYRASGSQKSWLLALKADGKLLLVVGFDGSAVTQYVSTAATGVTDGATADIMVRRKLEEVRFYVNGVMLGDAVACVTTALHAGTANVYVGDDDGWTVAPLLGSISRARVWNSAVDNQATPTETPVLDVNFALASAGATSFTATSGQVVTINSTAIANPALIRSATEGVLVNAPTSSRSTPAEDASYNHRSILLNGSDEYMDTGADATLATRSYSFWAKSSDTAENGVFAHGTSAAEGAFVFNGSSGKPILYLASAYYRYWVDNSAQDDGAWHHHVVYLEHDDITNCKWYVDGVAQSTDYTVSSGSADAYTAGIWVGKRASGFFDGSLSDFAVFEGELSAATVTAIYNNGVPADLSKHSPRNWWRMGEGDDTGGEVITDVGSLQPAPVELVTNGGFDADTTGWATNSGGTLTWSNGTAIAGAVGTDDRGGMSQTFTTVIGLDYQLSFDVVSRTSTNWEVYRHTAGAAIIVGTALGSHSTVFTAVATSTQLAFFAQQAGTSDGTVAWDNISIKQVLKGNPGGLINAPTFSTDSP